jgi:hypothetical protein
MIDTPSRETIIIVHGTWAAPEEGKTKWYQPDGGSKNETFTTKLDTALAQRGSPARCWAHCGDGQSIFTWTGENSWIGRTRASGAPAAYVSKLQEQGWRCHILGHSHGGNVIADALPEITASARIGGREPGRIAILGTPFIDTMSTLVQKRAERALNTEVLSWIIYTFVMRFAAYHALKNIYEIGLEASLADWQFTSFLIMFGLAVVWPIALSFRRRPKREADWHNFWPPR